MKTDCQTQPCSGARPCCAPRTAADHAAEIPAGVRRPVDWTDGLRPFLGLYIFKG